MYVCSVYRNMQHVYGIPDGGVARLNLRVTSHIERTNDWKLVSAVGVDPEQEVSASSKSQQIRVLGDTLPQVYFTPSSSMSHSPGFGG